MDWNEITVYTTPQGIDILSGELISYGLRGLVTENPADFCEFLNDTEIHWDYIDEDLKARLENAECNVKFYLPQNAQGFEQLNEIKARLIRLKQETAGIDLGRLSIETSVLNEEDWSTAWKKYYHPVRVGRRLVVVPCWEDYEVKSGEVKLTLDPGMAFGTGTHETTRLCMTLLEDCVNSGSKMLDIGTGSGILAIAALLLGAKSAVGVDIDELAVKIAGENAELNGVLDRLSLHCGDLTEKVSGKFDVICANIVADVIIRLSGDVAQFMDDSSVLLVSGIIEERCSEVCSALTSAGLCITNQITENGWAAVKLKLK